MMMLDGVAELTLDLLNQATQAWVEIEYNHAVHRETKSSPAARFVQAPDVLRVSPSSESLRDAFRLEVKRSQPHSDGTIPLDGVRFEIPARYRHFCEVLVRDAPGSEPGRSDRPGERTDSGSRLPSGQIGQCRCWCAVIEPDDAEVPPEDRRRSTRVSGHKNCTKFRSHAARTILSFYDLSKSTRRDGRRGGCTPATRP